MHVLLPGEAEAQLKQGTNLRGIFVPELPSEVLMRYVAQTGHSVRKMEPLQSDDLSPDERHTLIENNIAWRKERSPDWEAADPYGLDWQAIKAEGRRF